MNLIVGEWIEEHVFSFVFLCHVFFNQLVQILVEDEWSLGDEGDRREASLPPVPWKGRQPGETSFSPDSFQLGLFLCSLTNTFRIPSMSTPASSRREYGVDKE